MWAFSLMRPEPLHDLQGVRTTEPWPRQIGQGCCIRKKPPPLMTAPVPPHCLQVSRLVPGAAPEP